jgi:N-acetyl-gamma-glutamyl-phosphate reductase
MIRAGIVGGTGYTGVELLRLLAQHSQVKLTAITSRKEVGTLVADMYPSLRGRVSLAFSEPSLDTLKQCDVVFFATPHGVAMEQARNLLEAGVKVIDLAADFRLKNPAEFTKWYAMEHTCTDLLEQAVYGLAEVNRDKIRSAHLVGLAGCYPTAVQLGLKPLLAQTKPLINENAIIADCKSGVSGAGRQF